MPEIVIVDTTVFLNLLNVPRHNDRKNDTDRQFEAFLNAGARFILPLAVVFQAGDHVSNLQKGDQRRHWRCIAPEVAGHDAGSKPAAPFGQGATPVAVTGTVASGGGGG